MKGVRCDADRWNSTYEQYINSGGEPDRDMKHYKIYHTSWQIGNGPAETSASDLERSVERLDLDGVSFTEIKALSEEHSIKAKLSQTQLTINQLCAMQTVWAQTSTLRRFCS